uniref:Envelope glycoprotein n=1 Tax=Macrostomum lignano TaxID=282301 RepID=A0A1I8F515_9PLAT
MRLCLLLNSASALIILYLLAILCIRCCLWVEMTPIRSRFRLTIITLRRSSKTAIWMDLRETPTW